LVGDRGKGERKKSGLRTGFRGLERVLGPAAAAAFVENERRGFATFSLPLFSPSLPLFSLSLPLSLSLSLLARRPKKQAQKIAV
jgi:hypothetical protein